MAAGSKPAIVLVHGAFADASGWSEVFRALTSRGYPVYAPANPLRFARAHSRRSGARSRAGRLVSRRRAVSPVSGRLRADRAACRHIKIADEERR
jgi:hypothetical protein